MSIKPFSPARLTSRIMPSSATPSVWIIASLAARDASEAMIQTEGVALDGIILDVNLAGENGLMLMKFLKRNHPDVPIILYTGLNHDEAAIQTMLKEGARQYLRKGTMEELFNTVHGLIK